ncbi:MAG: ACP S-malonyltransferase [Treponema sp.]|nr:ACP S-malonyltransferase [Treponema sp.]
MSKKYAFLFPGQGAQAPGMIKDVCEAYPETRKILDDISAIWGKDICKIMWESDAAELSRSDNSQMAITAASLVVGKVLETKGITPSVAMGFSLGEFPALYFSGVLSFEDLIKVVAKRGSIMQNVCEQIAKENEGHAPGMTAVIGLTQDQVRDIASKCENVYAANMNADKQTVLSGTADGLTKAEELCKEAGARRAIRLAVAGPFHSPLMQRAADEFEKAIADVTFNDPKITLLGNVTGKEEKTGDEIKKNAVLHLTNSVLWTDEEKVLFDMINADSANEWALVEPGVGQVLTGLWNKSDFAENIKAAAANSAESISNVQ